MSNYTAPLKDIAFILKHVVGLDEVSKLPGCEEVSADLVDAIFEEAGKFAGEVLAPLNHPGDIEGAKIANGVVTTPKGFKDAYWKFVDGGWCGLEAPAEQCRPGARAGWARHRDLRRVDRRAHRHPCAPLRR